MLKELEAKDLQKGLSELLELEIDSLAVCLLNSYENPVHEIKIKEIISQQAPDLSLSTSFEVLPQIRE